PAPRGAEQVNALEPELLPDDVDFLAKDADVPFDVLGTVGVAAADLVVEDDRPFVGKPFERCEVVVSRAGPAVQGEQRRRRGVAVADDAVPGAIPAEVDVSLLG